MRKTFVPLVLACAVVLAAADARADEQSAVASSETERGVSWFPAHVRAAPCRPTTACTADIVPEGALEVEAGYKYVTARGGTGTHATPFLLKWTVLPWLQLQGGGSGETVTTGSPGARYFDDVGVGLKVHFLEQTRFAPSLSTSVHFFAPTAAARGYVRDNDVAAWLYASKDIGPLHADVSVAAFGLAIDRTMQLREVAAAVLSTELPLHVTPFAEIYRYGRAGDLAPRDAGFLVGVAYAPRPWLVFDASLDVSFHPEVRLFTTQLGMTIVPADLWESAAERRARKPLPLGAATSAGL